MNLFIKCCLLPVLILVAFAGQASSQLFVISNSFSGHIGMLVCNFNGTITNVWPLLTDPRGITTDGTNLYVADYTLGVVGEYTTSGGIVNPSLVSGLTGPLAMAVSGTNLFVSDDGRIGEYSTSGMVMNSNLITGFPSGTPYGVAVIGTNLYVCTGSTIEEFTTGGATVNASLISGLNFAWGLGTDGTNLFVAGDGGGTIGKYSPSGAALSPILVNGLNGPNYISVLGTNIFVAQNGATVGEYTTSGGTVNASFLTGGHWYNGVAAVPLIQSAPPSAPPPAIGITTYSNQPVVIWPATAGNYVLQTTTNLASSNWVTITNYTPFTGAMVTNASSPAFFRLH